VEFAVINLLLLAPVATLLVLRGARARFVQVVVACIALSVTIETLQLFHPSRGTNVDDLLFNSVGAVAGAVLGGIGRLVRPTTREHRAARRRRDRRAVSQPSPTGS
jgi:glycopeptide antibiotics resistance protein